MEKPQLLGAVRHGGRSNQGGEPICGPEHEPMTAASRKVPYGSCCTGFLPSADRVLTPGRPLSWGKTRA